MCIWVYLKKNILTILCVKGIMEWEFTRFYSTTNNPRPTRRGEMARTTVNKKKLEELAREVLKTLGCDPSESDDMRDTPRRMAETWMELTAGLDPSNLHKLETTFRKACGKEEWECHNTVVLGGKFQSLCAHHFLAFRGRYIFAYVPDKLNIGASKVQRMFNLFGSRPQGQEKLAHDVADMFTRIVKPLGVAVWCGGVHDCMGLRGVKASDAWMENVHLQGVFLTSLERRAEFMSLASRGKPNME